MLQLQKYPDQGKMTSPTVNSKCHGTRSSQLKVGWGPPCYLQWIHCCTWHAAHEVQSPWAGTSRSLFHPGCPRSSGTQFCLTAWRQPLWQRRTTVTSPVWEMDNRNSRRPSLLRNTIKEKREREREEEWMERQTDRQRQRQTDRHRDRDRNREEYNIMTI